VLLLGLRAPPTRAHAATEVVAASGPIAGPIAVLDGDTLRLADGTRVRLPGVDCPETGRPYADEATRFTAAFLAGHAPRLVPAHPPRDHYGRLLADVRVDGASLSAGLVESGLAWIYEDEGRPLVALQARAVVERRGVHERLARVGPLPLVFGKGRFHRADCPLLAGHAAPLDCSWDVAALLASGRAPCRTCLPWPP
jgi:endonuclease YncB( thermonuclease family)